MDGRQRRSFRPGGDTVLVLGFLLVVVFYGAETLTFRRTMMSDLVGPALFPQLLALFGIALVIAHFVGGARRPADDIATDATADRLGARPAKGWRDELRNLSPLAPVLLYVLVLEPIGFIPATLLYIAISMRMFGVGWAKTAAYTIGLTLIFFVLFYYVLLTNVPMGRYFPIEDYLPFIKALRRAIELR